MFLAQSCLLNVFSFLSVADFYHLALVNKQFYQIISNVDNDFLYKSLVGGYVKKLFKNSNDTQNYIMFRGVLEEFYLKPFEEETYQSEAYINYKNCGGVLEIATFKPCELLTNRYSLFSTFQRKQIHKFILVNNFFPLDEGVTVDNINFKTPGKFFFYLLENEFNVKVDKKSNKKEKKKEKRKKNNESNQVLDLSLFGEPQPLKKNKKLLETKSPPYGIRNKEEYQKSITEITNELFDYFENCEILNWQKGIEEYCWHPYWSDGLEWWGIYCYTIYNFTTDTIIVVTGSATD
ncbi:hypothetical protein ABK040_007859 [Willaertia magna]